MVIEGYAWGLSSIAYSISIAYYADLKDCIGGVVTDASGNPIPDAEIYTVKTDGGDTKGYSKSDKDGKYILYDLGPGTFQVTAVGYGYKKSAPQSVITDGEEDPTTKTYGASEQANFTLQKSAFYGKVNSASQPVENAIVWALDGNGGKLGSADDSTSILGYYNFSSKPQGTSLRVEPSSDSYIPKSLKIGSGDTLDFSLIKYDKSKVGYKMIPKSGGTLEFASSDGYKVGVELPSGLFSGADVIITGIGKDEIGNSADIFANMKSVDTGGISLVNYARKFLIYDYVTGDTISSFGADKKIKLKMGVPSGINAQNAILFHYDSKLGVWEKVLNSVVESGNVVGQVENLSIFAVLGYSKQATGKNVEVWPNPVYMSGENAVTSAKIVNLPDYDVSLAIYDISGDLVRKFKAEDVKDKTIVEWDLKNDYGLEVANGFYVLCIKSKSEETATYYNSSVINFVVIK